MKKTGLRMMVSLGVAVVLSVSTLISVSAATTKPKATPAPAPTKIAYTGYLLDGHCAKTGIDDETGKINVKKSPEKHTTSCLKLDMCMAEGVGITVKQTNGTYKYFKFDKAGAKKADDTIMMMTSRKFNNKISITGTLKGNTISLSTIKETK